MNSVSLFARRNSIKFFIIGIVLASATDLKAQGVGLEEIVVTAQRREQSLQEVPISLEVFSGDRIKAQGYRNLEDLGKFSPGITISETSGGGQIAAIRGFASGTTLMMQSTAPLFVDGIHYGNPAMVKTAFMDIAQLEILKGPQPLYFGMGATAGAFNIQSQRPSFEWEGDVSTEIANDGKRELSGAIGGPINETLAFRLAVTSEKGDGPAKSYLDGSKFPKYDTLGGRVSFQWNPNERFDVYTKFDYSRARNGTDISMACLTEGRLAGFPNLSPLNGNVVEGSDRGNAVSVLAAAPKGVTGGTALLRNPDGALPQQVDGDHCFDGDYGFDRDRSKLAAPLNTTQIFLNHINSGAIDVRDVVNRFLSTDGTDSSNKFSIADDGLNTYGIGGQDFVNSWNGVIEANYELDNGINLQSQTGLVHFWNLQGRDNTDTPIFVQIQEFETKIDQYSQQLRLTSPDEGYDLNVGIPGGLNLDVMVGGFWQKGDRDMFSTSFEATLLRANRHNDIWEDTETFSGFWGLTFNLLDKQLAIDAGGRYTDESKGFAVFGTGSTYIFDKTPCDSQGTDANPATCTPDPDFKRVHVGLTTRTFVDPVTGRGGIGSSGVTNQAITNFVRVDSPRFLASDADLNNLWARNGFGGSSTSAVLNVPLNWQSPLLHAVGLTAAEPSVREGPFGPCDSCIANPEMDSKDYNSQVVVRYTPNALNGDHTFYGKYVEAFKGGFANIASNSLPADISQVIFAPEYVASWEAGARGTLLDSRVRYDVSAFTTKFTDLQTSLGTPNLDPTAVRAVAFNAGSQKVKGVEVGLQAAATQNLVFNFGGAFMDGKFGELDGGGCTGDERIAAAIDATTPVAQGGSRENRSTAELTFANGTLTNLGPTRRANLPARSDLPEEFFFNGGCRMAVEGIRDVNTFNRSGSETAFTPDWSFVLGAAYTQPFMDNFEVFFDVTGKIEAEKLISIQSREITWASGSGDVTVSAGFGPQDAAWKISGFVRNIMENRPVFNEEFDLEQKGLFSSDGINAIAQGTPAGLISESSFRSYGVRFQYFFQ